MGRAQGGLGIGLSLVRSLVEMHGGTVRAHSEGEGRGSSFVVELPLAGAAPAGAARAAAAAAAPGGRLLKVLVADDNVDAAHTIMALLAFCGHAVDIVHDGHAALDKAQSGRYDLAILDIGMPGLDGYGVASALRANPACGATYLTALTGWGSDADQARARAAGFDAHLTKPAGIARIGALLAGLGARGPAPS